jgi:hypothetical protein
MPTMPKVAAPKSKIHFAAHNAVRLPQGIADVKGGDPGVFDSKMGKI